MNIMDVSLIRNKGAIFSVIKIDGREAPLSQDWTKMLQVQLEHFNKFSEVESIKIKRIYTNGLKQKVIALFYINNKRVYKKRIDPKLLKELNGVNGYFTIMLNDPKFWIV